MGNGDGGGRNQWEGSSQRARVRGVKEPVEGGGWTRVAGRGAGRNQGMGIWKGEEKRRESLVPRNGWLERN